MNEDEKHEIYFKGYKARGEHNEPSPATKTFMAEIKKEISHINEKLDKMPTRDEMLLSNARLVEEIFKKTDERYASRSRFEYLEKSVYAVGATIIGAFVVALIVLVFKDGLI